jgi:hypothetical protein
VKTLYRKNSAIGVKRLFSLLRTNEDDITKQLNDCLLTPEELETYRYRAAELPRHVNLGEGLFNVGGYDNTDVW